MLRGNSFYTSQMRFCCSKVSLGSFFLSISMESPTMYSRQMAISCWACEEEEEEEQRASQAPFTPCLSRGWMWGVGKVAPHLGNLLLVVHHEQRHAQQDGPELLHCLLEFAGGGELVAELQALDQVIQLQANCRDCVLQGSFLPEGGKGEKGFGLTGQEARSWQKRLPGCTRKTNQKGRGDQP